MADLEITIKDRDKEKEEKKKTPLDVAAGDAGEQSSDGGPGTGKEIAKILKPKRNILYLNQKGKNLQKAPGIVPGILDAFLARPQSNFGQFGPEQQGRTTAYYAGKTLGDFIRQRALNIGQTSGSEAQAAARVPGTPQYQSALQAAVQEQAYTQKTGELTPEQYQKFSQDVATAATKVDGIMADEELKARYNIKTREDALRLLMAALVSQYGANTESKIRNILGIKSGIMDKLDLLQENDAMIWSKMQ